MSLDHDVEAYCKHRILPDISLYQWNYTYKKIKQSGKGKKRKPKGLFLPPSVAVCGSFHSCKDYSYSHSPLAGEKKHPLYTEFKIILSKLRTKFPVGHCAEQHVAIKLFNANKKYKVIWDRDHIKFSKAVRPRTLQTIPYCDNCKCIFPQL